VLKNNQKNKMISRCGILAKNVHFCIAIAISLLLLMECATGGMPRELADRSSESVRWEMLKNFDPQGTYPISDGPSIIKVENPGIDLILVIFFDGKCAGWFFVPSGSDRQYSVSNGEYKMYFVFAGEPKSLYQGDDVSVNNQINTIVLKNTTNGNYGFRRIR
jgi:hypothetical protein